jgi:hypothetical protein
LDARGPVSAGLCFVGSYVGETMRAIFLSMPGWDEPDAAPLDEQVISTVTDGQGEPYLLQSPCQRTVDGWISSKNRTRLLVMPVKWRR